MSFRFQPFNYPSNISCCLSKQTSQGPGNKNPSLLNSINKTSSDRNSNTQSNRVGIIEGVSIDSTLYFTKKLVNMKMGDEQSSPPFILSSDPPLSKELLSLERSSIVENLRQRRLFLEKSGVCCILMPCHTSHSWHDEIKEGCSVPFLHVGECVAKELKEAKLRPLEAGSPLRIGVLATDESLVARIYQEKLENEGFEVIVPDKATMEHTVIPAVEALKREDIEGAQNLFRIALQVLLVRAVNRIILASDELHQILPPDDPLWTKCIDPMAVLARSSIKYAQSTETGK